MCISKVENTTLKDDLRKSEASLGEHVFVGRRLIEFLNTKGYQNTSVLKNYYLTIC